MQDIYADLRDRLLGMVAEPGIYDTGIAGLRVTRRDSPSDFIKCIYNTACIFVIQGSKNILYGQDEIRYGKGEYVVSCVDMPVTSRVFRASEDEPFLALVLDFDSKIISDLILQAGSSIPSNEDIPAFATTHADKELADSFLKLLELTSKSVTEREIMAPMLKREIFFRILMGPIGGMLKVINTGGTKSHQIASAIEMLKQRFSEKISMDELAQCVNMATSTFYRNFKRITKISPLQYQKLLRLQEARRLMLADGFDATTACYEVGYESPTQFSREYKKVFGNPPRLDIRNLAAG